MTGTDCLNMVPRILSQILGNILRVQPFLTNLLRSRGLGRAFGVGRLFDSVVVLIEEGVPWLWFLYLNNDDKTLFFGPENRTWEQTC